MLKAFVRASRLLCSRRSVLKLSRLLGASTSGIHSSCANGSAGYRRASYPERRPGVVANLSTAIATTSLAQTAIQEMGAYASYHQDGNLGIAPTPIQRREMTVVGRGTADVMASAPSIPSSKRGLETTTRPWSAPVGHRQPRADDVHTSTSVSQQSLDEEDANVDRKIKSVCRGC